MKIHQSLIDRLKTQHQAIENILSTIDDSRIKIILNWRTWPIDALLKQIYADREYIF